MNNRLPIFALIFLLASSLLAMTFFSVQATPEALSLTRPTTPVIVQGDALGALLNTPISELRLYSYSSDGWAAIPFQIDEVTAAGIFTTTEDGLIDANDQLTFMSHDAGFVASLLWVDDDEAQGNERVELLVADPLLSETAAVYLYRSSSLAMSNESYVSWDNSGQAIVAAGYQAGFAPTNFLGMDSFQLAGQSNDILDRQKLRVDVQIIPPPPFPPIAQQFTEEDLATQFGVPATLTLPISGPIRALGGGEAQQVAFYGWQFVTEFSLDVSDVFTNLSTIHTEQLRSSRDWLSPVAAGYGPATYFDSNTPAGVPVDGSPDAVSSSPAATWQELSTAQGTIVSLSNIDPGQGTVESYYHDNNQFNGNDTGDGFAYGDYGFTISEPNGVITVTETTLILAASSSSQGAITTGFAQQPLTVTTTAQSYQPINAIYLPVISRP